MPEEKGKDSDRTAPTETPRMGQDLRATGEGGSVAGEDSRDDNTYVFDGGCQTQSRRDSSCKRPEKSCRGTAKIRRRKIKLKKKEVSLGTWNMQTMQDEGHIDLAKLDLLLNEQERLRISILGLCETRWSGEGKFERGDCTIIFSGNPKGGSHGVAIVLDKHHSACLKSYNNISDRMLMIKLDAKPVPINIIQVYAPTSGSPQEDIELFYSDLQTAKDKIPGREVCIIMGDFNAKVGEGKNIECGIGPFGHGSRNDRGDMLATFCQANKLIITNTCFEHPYRRRYTWISPLDESRHQIDYILIDKIWQTSVINARTRPGADSDSDHLLVTMKIRLKAVKQKKSPRPYKYNLDKLRNTATKSAYEIETNNRFEVLLEEWSANEALPEEIWNDMKKVYTEAAQNNLGKSEKNQPKPYISDETLRLAREKRNARKENRKDDYRKLKKEIRAQIRRDKSLWLETECSKITLANAQRKTKEFFRQINKVKGSNLSIQNQSLNDKSGKTLTEMNQILDRWHEYGKELFDTNSITGELTHSVDLQELEPLPLKEEVTDAIKQLKDGKSPGMDNIPSELLKNSGPSSFTALYHLCKRIWETCQWPSEWKQQEFVMLHKGGDTKDCGNYRTIALISHTSKILLIILLNRMKNKIEREISDCQAGYRRGRGTTDMLFVLQILIEKIRNTEDEAFITFIDYSKAFDSVKHHHLFDTMLEMGFPKHLVLLIANLYTDQKATIRWNGEHCEFFDIKKGVRQGCILSPHLFSIYTEMIMRKADTEGLGISIGGRNITNLRYADDTALMANDITSMRRILYRVDAEGNIAGLKLNAKKTKVMHINGVATPQNIKVNGTDLEYVQNFKYLGSIKENNGSCQQDVRARIGMAKQKMIQLNNIWKDRGIPKHLKIRIVKTLIWPILMYGSEAWTLRKLERDKINAAEMWFYRRLLRVKWSDRRTNDSILNELSVRRQMLAEIDKRRLRYVGHANRNTQTNLMTTVLQGKVEGRRKRGRPPTSYIANIAEISGLGGLHETVQLSRNRERWRTLPALCGAPTVDSGDGDSE